MKKFTRVLFYALNLMAVSIAREPSCPICSRYDYEERILERVLSNELEMKHMLKDIRETNAKVEAALKVIQEDKAELASAMNAMKTAQADMKSMMDDEIQGGRLNLSRAVIEMTTKTTGAIKQMEKENTILKEQLMIPTLYFYARASATSSLQLGQTVIYSAVDINEGQGYDPTTGRFTVSVPGLYAFVVQYCPTTGNYVWLEIVNQKKTLQRGGFKDNSNNIPCVSMQVFIKADVSDQIWVKSTGSTSQFHSDSYRYNSFSGALVHV